MAIATLAEVCCNTDVFKRVVKIRKGLAAKLMLSSRNMCQTSQLIAQFADEIREKLRPYYPDIDTIIPRVFALDKPGESVEKSSIGVGIWVTVALLALSAMDRPAASRVYGSVKSLFPSLL